MTASLILPCYNPPPLWEQHIHTAYASLCSSTGGDMLELILVIDGACEGVADAHLAWLRSNIPAINIIAYPENKGKGYAIRQGVAAAAGEIILYTDVDFPYSHDSLMAIYKGLKADEYDVGIGIKDSAYYARVPRARRIISRYLRALIRIFLSMPVTDTQCGLKGFRRGVAPMFLSTTINRYLFDLEFIRNCYKSKKYRIAPIPAALNDNIHFRSMDYRILLPEMLNFAKLLFNRTR